MISKKERLNILKFIQKEDTPSIEDIVNSLKYNLEDVKGALKYLDEKRLITCKLKSVDGLWKMIDITADGIDMIEEEPPEQKKETFIGRNLRVFISYSEEDKLIAKGIKDALNHYGVQGFLAHEDIPTGEDWVESIKRGIKQNDIFIAMLSKKYKESDWTDQEVGIAVANEKLIIPVSIDGCMPYGFMMKYQAFKKFKYEKGKHHNGKEFIYCYGDVFKIIKMIGQKEEFKENLKDCFISSLKNAGSFRGAEEIMETLVGLGSFNSVQINQIIINCSLNNQVYQANGCQPIIRNLIKEYDKKIDEENKEKIKEVMAL
ncbi:hypothetical protein CEE44_00685 [Candidatus Woesearchaeota archaeon B3_Woes]|nr:MAG: hypothetical protein CEE44_00685 [Candidatus Woesearchaeota archaeon B3_Woes]